MGCPGPVYNILICQYLVMRVSFFEPVHNLVCKAVKMANERKTAVQQTVCSC